MEPSVDCRRGPHNPKLDSAIQPPPTTHHNLHPPAVLDWDLTVNEKEMANLYPVIIVLYPRMQHVVSSPSRPARCPTFTIDPTSDDSSNSSSAAVSSPHIPCDSEKTIQFISSVSLAWS